MLCATSVLEKLELVWLHAVLNDVSVSKHFYVCIGVCALSLGIWSNKILFCPSQCQTF